MCQIGTEGEVVSDVTSGYSDLHRDTSAPKIS